MFELRFILLCRFCFLLICKSLRNVFGWLWTAIYENILIQATASNSKKGGGILSLYAFSASVQTRFVQKKVGGDLINEGVLTGATYSKLILALAKLDAPNGVWNCPSSRPKNNWFLFRDASWLTLASFIEMSKLDETKRNKCLKSMLKVTCVVSASHSNFEHCWRPDLR